MLTLIELKENLEDLIQMLLKFNNNLITLITSLIKFQAKNRKRVKELESIIFCH